MTNGFELDARLAKDCLILGKLDLSLLLLMNNSLVPWFILVPNTNKTEMTDLPLADQEILLKEINLMSGYIKVNSDISKLNIAAIGNIVSQLHIHIVGRDPSDFCWPDVVWGTNKKKLYTDQQVTEISTALAKQLGKKFSSHN